MKLSLIIKIFALYTNTFLPSLWEVSDTKSIEGFYPNCVASSGHHVSVSHRFEISLQTIENRRMLS
jgi:hypothetical protein